jgi:pimeloyl-ACP methyl ester carboxylesterase
MAASACVLVHGGWHGGWHWDAVAQRLRGAGVPTFAPTLRGLAERAAEATETTCLADHVEDVVQVLDDNDLCNAVLVGHSYGGAVITGVAQRCPGRVAQLVYLDALVPRHGESLADIFGPEFVADAHAKALASGTPHLVPPTFAMEDVLGVGPVEAAAHAARLTSHPLGTMLDGVDAQGPLRAARTFIYCSRNPLGLFDEYARRARESNDWRYFELPSPHDAVYAMPAVVAAIVEHLANEDDRVPRNDDPGAVLAADRAFFDALLAGDVEALDQTLAADFVIVDVAAAGLTERAAFIAAIEARTVRFDAIVTDPNEARVRVRGDTATVIGRTAMRLRLDDGQLLDVQSRYTHVFERAPAGWQLASAQGTQMR